MSTSQTARRAADAFESRLSERRDVGAELDNIFRLTTAATESVEHSRVPVSAPAAPAEPRRVSQADLDAALEMLSRAAQAMDILQARYQQVETYARDIAQRAERDLAAAVGQVKDGEARALGAETRLAEMKARLDEAEGLAEAARARAEKFERHADFAERQAEAAQQRAEKAEQNATEAREWLECFHDRIVASFDTRPFPKSAAA